MQSDGSLTVKASSVEHEVLRLMTPAQGVQYLRGRPSSEIKLSTGEMLDQYLKKRGVSNLDLSWHSIDGGGSRSAGGSFQLTGTAGQSDSAALAGGDFKLIGGFSAGVDHAGTGSVRIFCNGFDAVPSNPCSVNLNERSLGGDAP